MPETKPPTNRQTHAEHLVQTGMLKRFKTERTKITLLLMNGAIYVGTIIAYDQYSIEFSTVNTGILFLYKHGIIGFIA